MSFEYENQGTNTYLVYSIAEDDVIDSMSLRMLTNNNISGLSPTLYTESNANKYIKYNISAKISLNRFFKDEIINRERLLRVFLEIINTMNSVEDYMIEINMLLLNKDYIFIDVLTCEPALICLPLEIKTDRIDNNLAEFFRDIMVSIQFDQTEDGDYIVKIINYLNSSPVFSPVGFKQLLEELSREKQTSAQQKKEATVSTEAEKGEGVVPEVQIQKPSEPVMAPTEPQPAPIVQQPGLVGNNTSDFVENKTKEKKISFFGLLMHYSKENAELYKAQKADKKNMKIQPDLMMPSEFTVPGAPKQNLESEAPSQMVSGPREKAMSFGETTVLGGGFMGETVVLNSNEQSMQQVNPYLIRKKNNETIPVNKSKYKIGQESTYADYVISDNAAISHRHAIIESRDGQYYITDTKSKNHTFVNGNRIQNDVSVEIKHGDNIRLANEDFEFRLN